MHVSAIDMSYTRKGKNNTVYTTVSIVDQNGGAVSGANVSISMSLPGGGTATGSAATASDGTVTFSYTSRTSGTYTSSVTDVSHASLTYDAGANVVSSASLDTP